jgi:hypothetical protein
LCALTQRQLPSLVPATYFITLPAELRGLAWGHQRKVYALLMQCAWDTLNTFSHNAMRALPDVPCIAHGHAAPAQFAVAPRPPTVSMRSSVTVAESSTSRCESPAVAHVPNTCDMSGDQ